MKDRGYGDMVALLEWVTKNKREKKYAKKEFTFKDYMKFKKELEEFEKWEKTMLKKDVKQEQKAQGLSVPQIAMIFMGTFPITAPLYVYAVKQLLVQ
jgi:hypothetical protein